MFLAYFSILSTALGAVITHWDLINNAPSGGLIAGQCPGAWSGFLGYNNSFEGWDPTYAPSRGYHFDGNQWITIPAGSFTIPGSYTTQALIYITSYYGAWGSHILTKNGVSMGASENQWNFRFDDSGVMEQSISQMDPSAMCTDGSVTVNLNQWIHVAISVAGNEGRIYLNNSHRHTQNSSTGTWADHADHDIHISWDMDGYACTDMVIGFIADVRMDDVVISDFSSNICTGWTAWGGAQCASWETDCKCLPTCSLATFPDYDTETWLPCDPGPCPATCNGHIESCSYCYGTLCTACSGPDPGDCSACVADASLHATKGCECDVGAFWATSFTCVVCDTRCTAWTSTLNTDCSACAFPTYSLQPNSTTCDAGCPIGYFSNSIGVCEIWWFACSVCYGASATECTACFDGFYKQPLTDDRCEVTCPTERYYKNGPPNNVCSLWDDSCDICTGPLNTECSQCSDDVAGQYYLQPNLTYTCLTTCPEDFWGNNDPDTCDPCHAYCNLCGSVSVDDCTECNPNYYLEYGGTSCLEDWGPHFWERVSDWTCQPCDPKCEQCYGSADNVWTYCSMGNALQPAVIVAETCADTCPGDYYENIIFRTCDPCHDNCDICYGGSKNECTYCAEYHYLQPGVDKCELDYCPANYFKNAVSRACETCDVLCTLCDGPTNFDCQSCSTGNAMQPPLATSENCEENCPGYFWENTVYRECWECDVACDLCYGPSFDECTYCAVNYFQQPVGPYGVVTLKDEWLEQFCPDGWYPDTATRTCVNCHGWCATWYGPTNNECNFCNDDHFFQPNVLQPDTCLYESCPPDYYYDRDPTCWCCPPCHDYCDLCTGPNWDDSCTLCRFGAFLQPSGTECLLGCPIGYYPDPDPVEATNSNTCLQCTAACVACWDRLHTTCQSCNIGWFLQPTPDQNTCLTTCPDGFYPDTTTQECELCHGWCLTCYGPANTQCPTCALTYNYVASDTCQLPCPDGQYANPNVTPIVCTNCHVQCVWCTDDTEHDCSYCAPGFFLQSNPAGGTAVTSCLSTCPAGTWANTSASSRECEQCHIYWKTCTDAGNSNWTECADNHYRWANQDCFPTCDHGHYRDTPNKAWVPCHNNCEVCADVGNNQCSQCKSGFFMQLDGVTCDTTCLPVGYYANSTSNRCEQCHQYCNICTGPAQNQCSECVVGYHLQPLSTECKSTCPGNYYEDGIVCTQCDNACQLCTGPGIHVCQECKSGSYLHQTDDSCLASCDPGYYPDNGTKACKLCHPFCKLCTGSSNTSCSECNINYFLQGTTCDSNCPDGEYENVTTNQCIAWHSECVKCHDGTRTDCDECIPEAELQSDKSWACISGQYAEYGPFACWSCNGGWLTCNGPLSTDCTSCAVNSTIQTDNSWVCDPGYYASNYPFTCNLCHEQCLTCSGGSLSQCTSCIANTTLTPSGTGTCVPDDGFYPTYNPYIVQGCAAKCETCTGPDENHDWTSCKNLQPAQPCCYLVANGCYEEVCGDGWTINNESCDDGNLLTADGCGIDWALEQGWSATPQTPPLGPHLFVAECGDGLKVGPEFCDDANTISGDGCDKQCRIENGWHCDGGNTTNQDICYEICGDGLRFPNEECDDDNAISGDGCSDTCTIEPHWSWDGGTPQTRDICICVPILNTAEISFDKLYLTIVFASDLVDLGIHGTELCSMLFHTTTFKAFGSNSHCSIQDQTLTVQFGNTNTFTTLTPISFVENMLKTTNCNPSAMPDTIAFNAVENTTPPPGFDYFVNVILTGPDTVYVCESITISAHRTTGLQGTYAQYKWSFAAIDLLEDATIEPDLYSIIVDEYFKDEPELHFEAGVLPAGRWKFNLQVTNKWNEHDIDEHEIVIQDTSLDHYPYVRIKCQDELTIHPWQSIIVHAEARASRCGSDSDTTLTYSWEIIDSSDNLVQYDANQTFISHKIFNIYQNLLSIGTYTIRLTVATSQDVSTFDTITVDVVASPLKAIISGADWRQQGVGTTTILYGNESYDPDAISADDQGLTYLWTCFPSCHLHAVINEPTLEIPGDKYYALNTVIFTLTITKDTRSAQDTTEVYFTDGTTAKCEIRTISNFEGFRILRQNQHAKLRVDCWTLTPHRLAYTWSSSNIDPSFLSDLTSRKIKLDPSQMDYLKTYTISMQVTDDYYGAVQATADITINTPPSSGTVGVTPTTGISYSDTFDIYAVEWVDEDLPLSFQYIYEGTYLTDQVLVNEFSTKLCEGSELVVWIFDAYDAVTAISYNAISDNNLSSYQEKVSNMYQNVEEDNPEEMIRTGIILSKSIHEYVWLNSTHTTPEDILSSTLSAFSNYPATAASTRMLSQFFNYFFSTTTYFNLTQAVINDWYAALQRIEVEDIDMTLEETEQFSQAISNIGRHHGYNNIDHIQEYISKSFIRNRVPHEDIHHFTGSNYEMSTEISVTGSNFTFGTTDSTANTIWELIQSGETRYDVENTESMFLIWTPDEGIFSNEDVDNIKSEEVMNDNSYLACTIAKYCKNLTNPHNNEDLFSDTYAVSFYDEFGNLQTAQVQEPIKFLIPLLDDQEFDVIECVWWSDESQKWYNAGWTMTGKFGIANDNYVICECKHATDFALKHIEIYVPEEVEASNVTTIANIVHRQSEGSSSCDSYEGYQNLLVHITFLIFLVSQILFWVFRKIDKKQVLSVAPAKNKYKLDTTGDDFDKPELEDEPPVDENKIKATLKFAIFYIWVFQKTSVITRDRKGLLFGLRLLLPLLAIWGLYEFQMLIAGGTCSSPNLFDLNQLILIGLSLGATLIVNWLLLFIAKEEYDGWSWIFYAFTVLCFGGSMFVYLIVNDDYSKDMIHYAIITWLVVIFLDIVLVSIASFGFFMVLIKSVKYPSKGMRSLLPAVHFEQQQKTTKNLFTSQTAPSVKRSKADKNKRKSVKPPKPPQIYEIKPTEESKVSKSSASKSTLPSRSSNRIVAKPEPPTFRKVQVQEEKKTVVKNTNIEEHQNTLMTGNTNTLMPFKSALKNRGKKKAKDRPNTKLIHNAILK